jgi:hypothetical protein
MTAAASPPISTERAPGETLRLAVWSGPRNLSTALMYAFAARGDCAVVDEPFYAAYLAATGADHPMRDAVMASQPVDPAQVAQTLTAPVAQPMFYQKHMAHHLLAQTPRAWMAECHHVLLIRHPARVIASYARKHPPHGLDDLGYPQLDALFDHLCATGQTPVVIDGTDIRAAPERALRALCAALGVAFKADMLNWPAGEKPFDGIWAPHWYGAVHRSTGFEGAEGPLPELSGEHARLAEAAMPLYARLAAHKIT